MKKLSKVSLRKATPSDIEFLWYLRNQPSVYRYFRRGRAVSWKEHINWIMPIIFGISPKTVFIIQKSGIPAGQVRFDYKTSDISISILKEFRGKGFAIGSLALAIKEIKKQKKAKKLIAEIHKKNLPSIKLFEKLGFKFKTKNGNWLKYTLDLNGKLL